MAANPKTHLSHVLGAIPEVHNGDLVCTDI